MTEPFTILLSLSPRFAFQQLPYALFVPPPHGLWVITLIRGPHMVGRLQAKLLQLLSSRSNRTQELSAPPPKTPHRYNDCYTLHEQNPVLKFDMQIAHCFTDSEGSSIHLSLPHTTNNVTRMFRDLIVPMKDALKLTAKACQLTFIHKSQSITPVTAIFLPSNVYALLHIPCFLLSLNQTMSSFPALTVETGS